MAYRAPRYSYVHAAREVGADAITVSDTAHDDFPVDNLIDDRAGTRFMWSGSVVDPTIDIDLLAGFDTGLSRLILPANHNVTSLYIEDDDNDGFSSPAALHASVGSPDTSPVPGTLYDSGAFDTGNSTQQHIRINIVGTLQYYVSQIFLTKIMTIGAGVAKGPSLADSPDFFRPNITQLGQPTGLLPTVQNGPDQREFELSYESPLDGADLTAMEALIAAVGMHSPFFVDPASFSTPPETDEPVLWMRFTERPDSRNSILVPMNGTRSKTFRLGLVESLD